MSELPEANPVNSIVRTPADEFKQIDSSVALINSVVGGTYPDVEGTGPLTPIVEKNVRHLELMVGLRVAELGESPDLSTYNAAIAAGKAYEEG